MAQFAIWKQWKRWLLVSGSNPEDRALAEDLDPALRTAMAALDERFRAVVVLVDVHDLSYADAAAVLDVPVGTIMSRLSRARTRLRAALAADSSRPGKETR